MKDRRLFVRIKSVAEDGTFEGLLSTYGNVDQGGDVVERGAFSKSLKDNGGKVPMLWQHNPEEPIGLLELLDGDEGLKCKGTLALEVPKAAEAYALMKRQIVKGLSIGYVTVKDAVEGGVRRLKELRLLEGSVVTFPMNLQAVIQQVKARMEQAENAASVKADFATELMEIQLYAARYQMYCALECTLDELVWDSELSNDEKVSQSRDSIDQFSTAYLEMLPQYLAMRSGADIWEMMSLPKMQMKAGAVLSAPNKAVIQQCIQDLQALLDAATPADKGAVKPSTSGTSEVEEKTEAVTEHPEPEQADHSEIFNLIERIKSHAV